MANPIPLPVAADATGLADASWIADVRDTLKDYPNWQSDSKTADGVNGVISATGLPYVLSRRPILISTDNGGVDPYVTNAGVAVTRDTANPPGAGKYYLNPDTGEIIFNAAPANANALLFTYQVVKWRDLTIMTALYAGMRAMFPHVGKTYVDTTVSVQVNKWDYALPSWAQDPRSQVIRVEVIDPDIATEQYTDSPSLVWYRVGSNLLHVRNSQAYSAVGRFRITGWGPYLELKDLEPQLYHLPIWYACGTLLMKSEGPRLREDTMIPITQEGARPPLANIQAGAAYLKLFWDELSKKTRLPGPGWSKRLVTSYAKRGAR